MVNKITTPPTQNEVIDKINELVDGKQDTLVSGTNIKTVGGTSLVGSGNVAFPTVDQTYSASSANAQSGVAVANAIAPKQDTLVSGTNIKTINGNSLLGSGNIVIETSSTPNVDGETISYNSSDALQAIAVKNVRDGSTLPIWHGTEYQWNHGDPTTWYYWQTAVQALWTAAGSLPASQGGWGLGEYCAYGNGVIVFPYRDNSYRIAYSTDEGDTWTSVTGVYMSGDSIAFGNNTFVITEGTMGTEYSTDNGQTWREGGLRKPAATWSPVAYCGDRFVQVQCSDGATIYSTDNGQNWLQGGSIPTNNAYYMAIAYGNNTIVAISGANKKKTAYSTDNGQTWQAGGDLPINSYWNSLVFGNGRFVAIANGKKTAYSTDNGQSWSQGGDLPVNGTWIGLAYGDGKFVANTLNTSYSAYSTDGGVTWNQTNLPANGDWRVITYTNGKFVAINRNNASSAVFTVQYDKCYTDTANPTTTSVVYSEPDVTSSYTISSVTSGAITLSNNNTYYYNQSGNVQTYDTIGNSHPEYLCFIDGVGVKMGNTVIATNNSNNS